jgi:hypothetical protein
MKQHTQNQSSIKNVSSFQELISIPFEGTCNALCWSRELKGDFSEIVAQYEFEGNMLEVSINSLESLTLREAGQLARTIVLQDYEALKSYGADPVLNIIRSYEKDDAFPLFPTDVYSFHVDRSPVATDTFLCTYVGDASELIPNEFAIQKIQIPELRQQLREIHTGNDADFEDFLIENFFDLHYQQTTEGKTINLGNGHLWRLAIEHPTSKVLPCVHRAPQETNGQKRLLLIC